MKTRVQKFYDQTQWLPVKQLKPISPINTFQWPQKTKVTQRTFFNNNVFTFWSSLAIINIFKFTNFYHVFQKLLQFLQFLYNCANSLISISLILFIVPDQWHVQRRGKQYKHNDFKHPQTNTRQFHQLNCHIRHEDSQNRKIFFKMSYFVEDITEPFETMFSSNDTNK